MTHVTEILLENWGPFRGKHHLKLEPIPYAIVATKEDDPERSNFCGKSYLLEAIRFALYGEHRHRLEEGWISKGEKEGAVTLVLSPGVQVQRWRRPGKGTQVACTVLTRNGVLSDEGFEGDVAQRKIEEIVGLGREDFQTTSYFSQGETAGMVRADPSARTATVARWLRLEKLDRCLALVRKRGETAAQDASKIVGRIEGAKERRARALQDEATVDDLRARVPDLEALLAEWDKLLKGAVELASSERLQEERARIVEEGNALRAVHDKEDGKKIRSELEEARVYEDSARSVYEEAKAKAVARRTVAQGTFDGNCPVAGIACPAKDQINGIGRKAQTEAKEANQEQRDAEVVWQDARGRLLKSTTAQTTRKTREERLRTLQERARAIPRPTAGLSMSMPLEGVQAERSGTAAMLAEVRRRVADAEEAEAQVLELVPQALQEQATVTACREAALVFRASQRRLAEGVLGVVEQGANRMLASAGVELQLEVTWEREGKELAEECSACGAAFPSSAKVKACGECGEARGKKRVQRLDVELSARSGAAEDLAGLALSLSAGAWLRGDRASAWACVAMDEPWSQLDKAHRRAASAYVPAMLVSSGLQQAFIISHDPASVASLPGRIEVVSDGKWSRVVVAA